MTNYILEIAIVTSPWEGWREVLYLEGCENLEQAIVEFKAEQIEFFGPNTSVKVKRIFEGSLVEDRDHEN